MVDADNNGTMRAIQVRAPGQAGFVEVPVPEVIPGTVLVQPLVESLCGSDVRSVFCAAPAEYPLEVSRGGHEIIARVLEVNGHAEVKPGDLALTLVNEDRGMSEYVRSESENVVPVPGGVPLDHLLMAQQLGTVIYSCRRLPNVMGKDVAVIGQGSAGLFFDTMLHRMGARRVIAIDVIAARCELAWKFGATDVIDNRGCDPEEAVAGITDGQMADLVVEAVGEHETINMMARLVKERGTLLSFGIPRGEPVFEFDYWALFRKYCHLITSSGAITDPHRGSFRMALDLIAAGEIDVAPMVTHRFGFDDVLNAYELARSRDDGVIKIVIEMPGYREYQSGLSNGGRS